MYYMTQHPYINDDIVIEYHFLDFDRGVKIPEIYQLTVGNKYHCARKHTSILHFIMADIMMTNFPEKDYRRLLNSSMWSYDIKTVKLLAGNM